MRYSKTHEWIDKVGEHYRVGISNYAQEHLSDLTFVECIPENTSVEKGKRMGTIESVKSAEDFYAPCSLKIIKINPAIADTPEIINKDAEKDGWIAEVRPTDEKELEELMDAAAYKEYLKGL